MPSGPPSLTTELDLLSRRNFDKETFNELVELVELVELIELKELIELVEVVEVIEGIEGIEGIELDDGVGEDCSTPDNVW